MSHVEANVGDQAAIRRTVELYFEGYLEAQAAKLEQAFHPSSVLHSSSEEGKLELVPSSDFLGSVRARELRGDRRQAQAEILSIDATADAASVKARLQFKDFAFVDYLSLLKLEGGRWQIVAKIYTKTV